ncbi:unnamed protein product [Parascedosporium putredinis]|uniref:Pterin-binding domain-containing protein n=1 Tax=Parascedosporium putredinis TaxID=1442378 RepID=A0A9P1H3B6_9PEZI|nr:unnamed protein product [Parascedosporium putredinis]CAI7995013.1 unnamed protein product [Parascedosporium putredinis]
MRPPSLPLGRAPFPSVIVQPKTSLRSASTASLASSKRRPLALRRHAPPPFSSTQRRAAPMRPFACCGGCGPRDPPPPVDRKRKAYIALGSNVGDRIAMIEEACAEMDRRGIRVTKTSSLWETNPMYVADQDKFINGACEVDTDLEPLALLDELQSIEKHLGREKTIDKGPRNIDLDILLYDNQKFSMSDFGLIPGTPIDQSRPWKLTQDYLNELPPADPRSRLLPRYPLRSPIASFDGRRPTRLMSILNVTPDSFSDGGINSPENLVEILASHARSGATMIDIGGQSTSPVLPSVDTYRAAVAEKAVLAGADIINDVSAGLLDEEMLPTMARLGKTVCLMHMRGTPQNMARLTDYSPAGLIPTIASELLERVEVAQRAGIRRWRIILDPGIGFAKDAEQNVEILRRLDDLRRWPGLEGLPWLVGSSRKGFVGRITGVTEPRERVWGTAATVAAAIQGGADIVRVHDVSEMSQVTKMSDAIWRGRTEML